MTPIKTSLFDETKWSNKEIVKNLRTLEMKDCNITSIEAESFDDLGKLQIINLGSVRLLRRRIFYTRYKT